MGREEQLLAESIRETISQAHKARGEITSLSFRSARSIDGPDEEYDEARETLRFYIEKSFRDVGILAERLGLFNLEKQIRKKRKSYEDITDLVSNPYDVDLYSYPLGEAQAFFNSLSTMLDSQAVTGLSVFKTILENTAAIIATRGLDPQNEKNVEKAIFEVVQFAFHDAVSQMKIPKILKSYKPEFGVPSLGAAAEYKFANDLEEVKRAVGGFYEDMRGYSGDGEWRNFYAVLYTTSPILHSKKLEEEFRLTGADSNWTPIVVCGPGGRVKNKPKKI